mgnify:CR=1 FL=1|tara:strand:- start:312 stop:1889 length:1578 start_codon:yes stop_codon:yes gene_type:complete
MRDLGLMGESTFSLWCADVGLIPNGSQIDKTGWDFFVEFPFDSGLSPQEIHKSAFECKVQVKATDKNDRKLPITLSNLRRLITAQMPAFFVFIEFDKKERAQRAYVIHVDNELISKTLKRLYEIEQSDKDNKFNKRTMTIHYDNSNLLDIPNGDSLKRCFLNHIGGDASEYIANKKSHLESTGYENGFTQFTFTTEGEENLKSLIDVSLGIGKYVDVVKFKGVDTRFGILSTIPSFDSDGVKLTMPNLQPTATGRIRFKEGRLSAGLSFECKFYISPFEKMVPDMLKKARIKGDFFDLIFNPYTGAASYSFSFGEGIRLEVEKFRNAVKLLNLLCNSKKKVFAELLFDNFPKLEFGVGCNDQEFDFSSELNALNCAVKIMADFETTDLVDISFDEISQQKTQICQMQSVIASSPKFFKVEFNVYDDGYDPRKQTACIYPILTPIGSHIFGVILVLTGSVEIVGEDRYRLITKDIIVEQRLISEKDASFSNEDVAAVIESIEEKYGVDFLVVNMFDKSIDMGIKLD